MKIFQELSTFVYLTTTDRGADNKRKQQEKQGRGIPLVFSPTRSCTGEPGQAHKRTARHCLLWLINLQAPGLLFTHKNTRYNIYNDLPIYLVEVLASSVAEGHLEHFYFLHDAQRVVLARSRRLAHEAVLDVEQNLGKVSPVERNGRNR